MINAKGIRQPGLTTTVPTTPVERLRRGEDTGVDGNQPRPEPVMIAVFADIAVNRATILRNITIDSMVRQIP